MGDAVKGKVSLWVRRFSGTCIGILRVFLIARDIWEQKRKKVMSAVPRLSYVLCRGSIFAIIPSPLGYQHDSQHYTPENVYVLPFEYHESKNRFL